MFLSNFGSYENHTASSYPRRQHSSLLTPLQHQILHASSCFIGPPTVPLLPGFVCVLSALEAGLLGTWGVVPVLRMCPCSREVCQQGDKSKRGQCAGLEPWLAFCQVPEDVKFLVEKSWRLSAQDEGSKFFWNVGDQAAHQETVVSAVTDVNTTDIQRRGLLPIKFWGFHGGDYEELRLLECYSCASVAS
jgi:hypothetical protein